MTNLFNFNKQQNIFIEDKTGKPLKLDSYNSVGKMILDELPKLLPEFKISLVLYQEGLDVTYFELQIKLEIVDDETNEKIFTKTSGMKFSLGQFYLQYGGLEGFTTVVNETTRKFFKDFL